MRRAVTAIATALLVDLAAQHAHAQAAPTDEVTIRGAHRDPGETSLTASEVRDLPGAFGDAFRAIEALPGATPMLSGIPYLFIRGAPPGNSGYFVDGVPVPLLYHVGFGPSVIAPALVDRVDYYPGGAPARYGGYVGGFVSADTTAPRDRPYAESTVRLFDAGALGETPFAAGRGDALVAGRYSYTAPALSLFSPGASLGYWDYQARVGYRVDDASHVGVFAFGSHDFRGDLPGLATFAADFHRIDVRYDRRIGDSGRLRVAATLGADQSANDQGSASGRLVGLRVEAERWIAPSTLARFGAAARLEHYDAGVPLVAADARAIAAIYPEHEEMTTGVYADLVWRPAPALEVTPGLRADLYDWRALGAAHASPGLDPRLGATFHVDPRVAIKSAVGVFHQGPGFIIPTPGVQPAGFANGLQTALQRSVGVEATIPGEVTASATAFWNEFDDFDSFGACSIHAGEIDVASDCVEQRSHGRAYGFELFVRRPFSRRLRGFLSYTLSRTETEVVQHGYPAPTQLTMPTAFDRTHAFSAAATYTLGRGWSAGARFVLLSGLPYTPWGLPGTKSLYAPGAVHGITTVDRFPFFYRVDVRVEKRWRLGKTAWLSFVLEGLNVTLQGDAVGAQCTGNPFPPHAMSCTPAFGSPLTIPSVGVEGAI